MNTYEPIKTPKTKEKCGRCAGTGMFITGTLNGKPVGPGGICYRCAGKGWQTPNDKKRNTSYDRYALYRAIAS